MVTEREGSSHTLKFMKTENHKFYESMIYLESTVNFITIGVPPPGLPDVGERHCPFKKVEERRSAAFPLNLSTR